MDIDLVRLKFNQDSMLALQIIIGVIMYGVALELKVSDFTRLFKDPKGLITGLLNHYVIFPAFTIALIYLFDVRPSVALGLVIVAACPGGNLSNVMTSLSGGKIALSVGVTSLTTILSLFATPFYMIFLGKLVPGSDSILKEISLNAMEIFTGIFFILGLPLIMGMATSAIKPAFAKKAQKVLSKLAFLVLILFVLGALAANFQLFLKHIHLIIGIVTIHNVGSLVIGYIGGYFMEGNVKGIKAMTLTSGIRNTALGLALVFQFFEGLGGMAMVVAWWGISQIAIGLTVSKLSKRVRSEDEVVLV